MQCIKSSFILTKRCPMFCPQPGPQDAWSLFKLLDMDGGRGRSLWQQVHDRLTFGTYLRDINAPCINDTECKMPCKCASDSTSLLGDRWGSITLYHAQGLCWTMMCSHPAQLCLSVVCSLCFARICLKFETFEVQTMH